MANRYRITEEEEYQFQTQRIIRYNIATLRSPSGIRRLSN